MDVAKSFTYMFEDEEWPRKILVGALFMLLAMVVIGAPFVYGYALEVVRRVARGEARPLPEWDNLGQKFSDGLVAWVIFLIWSLPAAVVLGFLMVAGVAPYFFIASEETALLFGCVSMLIWTVAMALLLVWGLLLAAASPAIITRYALTGRFSAAFELREIWQFTRANVGNVLVVLLVIWAASTLAGLGIWFCFVGYFFTTIWYYLACAHLLGQLSRQAAAQGAQPLTLEA
ncbi:MAG: DUF4013 domain-containing protein [Chloroflexi bacterium]|nr:DUF4013 domain-containing protein [Chloroflexota bacterium]